jgi:hypothetical protein
LFSFDYAEPVTVIPRLDHLGSNNSVSTGILEQPGTAAKQDGRQTDL